MYMYEDRRPIFLDTTLRDGEQSPGVSFSINQKMAIAKGLDQLGVQVIEAGIPIMGGDEFKAVEKILGMNLTASILTWNRCNEKDLRASKEVGAIYAHIAVPASDRHIYKKLRMTRDELLLRLNQVLELGSNLGLTMSVGAEDGSRADTDFLMSVYETALDHGVTRLRYADTVSALDPMKAYEVVSSLMYRLRAYSEINRRVMPQMDFHGHNDYGMATANALMAYKAGADVISCSMNGLGERAGNAALEEIALSLINLENAPVQLQLEDFMSLSEMVVQYSKREVSLSKPVVGAMVFTHEAGIHVDGLKKDPKTYAHLEPELLGRSHKIMSGKHGGKYNRG